jgi:hypothetical protein
VFFPDRLESRNNFMATKENIYFSPSEARQAFETAAQRYLHMSGEEFLRKWDAGEFDTEDRNPAVMHVASLLPLVGRSWIGRTRARAHAAPGR